MPSSTDILNAALAYARRGWRVIPIKPGTKKAAGRWKQFQSAPASVDRLRAWFGNGSAYSLAVILGSASGRLVCRDFDDMATYESWTARFPDLARTLPTVATARGRHVYFQAACLTPRKLDDGEYRANGNYCLLPPSLHPTGVRYAWLIPPPVEDVPLIDPGKSGLLPKAPTPTSAAPPVQDEAAPASRTASRLMQRTHRFLGVGAAERHRNSELFCAACDMAANKITQGQAEDLLLAACARCHPPYPTVEARPTIESAYSRPRKPARTREDPWGCYSIPRCIAQRRDLKPSDKLVLGALDYRQRDKHDCYPGQTKIAEDTGLNRDTVNQAIRRLKTAGLLTVRPTKGGANHYTTHLPEIPTPQAPAADATPVGESDTKRHDSDDVGTKDAEKQQDIHAEHPDGQTAPGRSIAT